MGKRKIGWLAPAMALACLLAAGTAQAADKLKVVISSTSFAWLPLYVADGAGLFAKENLDVEIINVKDGAVVVTAILNGDADVAGVGGNSVFASRAAGQPVKMLTPMNTEYTSTIFGRKDVLEKAGITAKSTLEQKVNALKGMRIGVISFNGGQHTIHALWCSRSDCGHSLMWCSCWWIRIQYIGAPFQTATYVSGPGTSNQWQLIADDEVLASELTPGRDQGESIKSPVVAPSIPGSYQLMACADYLNQVLETNKANNCLVIPFTIQTLPAPILSITKFQDEESCCTTNTGSRIKPNIWVKNSGPIAPATNVQVLYQVSSPVATGSQWVYIGYGIIEPRELPPGKTDEDYMEGSGFTIPKDNAWKLQWHQVRACIKPDGSAPSGDTAQGDICATYQRYSKK